MLFAFQPTRACIFDISAHQNMATVGSAIVAIIWKQPFLRSSAIVCDLRSSAIDCDYMETSLYRTWFYLLRSSAIIGGSQTIAEVFPYDRRRSQTLLRSAICDPRSYGNQPLISTKLRLFHAKMARINILNKSCTYLSFKIFFHLSNVHYVGLDTDLTFLAAS